jgi:hypothetical protein
VSEARTGFSPVTCVGFSLVQKQHRVTPFQLDVKVRLDCIRWPKSFHEGPTRKPAGSLNCYLLALTGNEA